MLFRHILIALVGMLLAAPLFAQAPAPAPDPENILLLDLSNGGRVAILLRPDVAPKHVERVKSLARQRFYNGLLFHRVIEGFMAQGGDPLGTGEGGSTLPDLPSEFNALPHLRGALSMARADDPNSANSQFFIMLSPRLTLDGKYTVFGRVISGMAYVDAIERGEPPANPTRIVQASIAADNIPPPVPGQAVPGPVASLLPAPAVETVQSLPSFAATPATSPAPEAAPAASPEPAVPAQPESEAPPPADAAPAPEAQPEAATPQ